ncbi:L-type lectin-domain containing receptor kinase IX.1 [Prunus yedoensis var. nudiflora]|uniref:L-type lectin-domain containing receptor kinase IX.1 n=1 Tax=Prunus yedoensis var. nudiflora TaxID=2094558 RepID=A0A314UBC4_PRUYE|nr:L-type lectin-domain containing receptor kinase IX.1 [Prunus yedoensis var. nudiflora]
MENNQKRRGMWLEQGVTWLLNMLLQEKLARNQMSTAFGVVVALEIACGRKPVDLKLTSNQVSAVDWVWEPYAEGKVLEAADPKLRGDFDDKQMECLLVVGLWCAHKNYKIRPSILQSMQMLRFEVPLPIPSSNMSMVETYSAPPTSLPMHYCYSATGRSNRDVSETNPSGYDFNTNSSQFNTCT